MITLYLAFCRFIRHTVFGTILSLLTNPFAVSELYNLFK